MEDDAERFFRRPPPWPDSEILRWRIAVEALCELTGERAVRGASRVIDDD